MLSDGPAFALLGAGAGFGLATFGGGGALVALGFAALVDALLRLARLASLDLLLEAVAVIVAVTVTVAVVVEVAVTVGWAADGALDDEQLVSATAVAIAATMTAGLIMTDSPHTWSSRVQEVTVCNDALDC